MAPFSPGARRHAQPSDTASTTSLPDPCKLRVTGMGKVECTASCYTQLQPTATLGSGGRTATSSASTVVSHCGLSNERDSAYWVGEG
ncbi:hypothetical protein JCM3770_006588 [Rhodotorula araucariae]